MAVRTSLLSPIFNILQHNNRVPTRVLSSLLKFNGDSKFSTGRTESNIIKSSYTDVEIPKISINELVFSETEKWGNHIVSECALTGRKFTYDEMQTYSKNLSGFLVKKLKLSKGDVVGILCPNCPEYVIIALGIINAGLIATTFNPIYTHEEITRQLLDSGTKVLITLTENWRVAKTAVESTKKSIPILTVNTENAQATPDGAINFLEQIYEKYDISDIPTPSAEDVAFMPYSSGTTGLPKGVLLTHSNIVSNLTQMLVPEIGYIEIATKERQAVIPSILPLFHIYGLVITMMMTLLRGSKNITLPKFDPKSFINLLKNHKPNTLFVAPPLVIFMTQDAVKPEYLSSVESVLSGAAPLGAADEEKFLEKVNKNVVLGQGYGMTETSPAVTITPMNKKSPPGSTGLPLPKTEIKIVDVSDPSKAPLGPNQIGELLVRGPQVMKGYHNRLKETSEILTEDGWLRTGDIGLCDENGNLTITDRMKELIKVKGFQVAPAELEEIVRDYPDVLEVGIIGIPHERYGEVPRAYVSLKPGVSTFNPEKLQEFVRNKVASYKELKGGIKVIDSIPKNPSGKILRRELKEFYNKHEPA